MKKRMISAAILGAITVSSAFAKMPNYKLIKDKSAVSSGLGYWDVEDIKKHQVAAVKRIKKKCSGTLGKIEVVSQFSEEEDDRRHYIYKVLVAPCFY